MWRRGNGLRRLTAPPELFGVWGIWQGESWGKGLQRCGAERRPLTRPRPEVFGYTQKRKIMWELGKGLQRLRALKGGR